MYSNFVVSSIMIWNRAAKVKKEIKTNASRYKEKCKKLQYDVNQLLTVNEVELKIEKNSEATPMNKKVSQYNQRKKTKRERMLERQSNKSSSNYNLTHMK